MIYKCLIRDWISINSKFLKHSLLTRVMKKVCVICGEPASYMVKGTSQAYCITCGMDCFSDLSFLQAIEEQAQELKKIVLDKSKEEQYEP